MVKVVLSTSEIMQVRKLARERIAQNDRAAGIGIGPALGITNPLMRHETGLMGERALHKWTGIPWENKLGDLSALDCGDYECRSTRHGKGSLLVHLWDKDDPPFVLAIVGDIEDGELEVTLAGWRYGRDAKDRRWWREVGVPTPAFFYPQTLLLPMEELPVMAEG